MADTGRTAGWEDEVARRRARAASEGFEITPVPGPSLPGYMGVYRVRGRSGATYQVEIVEPGAAVNRCQCLDFLTNGLGTCKHIEAVLLHLGAGRTAGPGSDPPRAGTAGAAPGGPGPLPAALGPAPEVLVFDLETQRTFDEVGGRHNVSRLALALGVTYSLRRKEFRTFGEKEVAALVDELRAADAVVGFNLVRFDYQVLQPYTPFDLASLRTLDILEELEKVLGHRVSLDSLARATLGLGKTADGLKAVEWFKEGRLDLVEEYCRADVDITRRLFEFGLRRGYLLYVSRPDGQTRRVAAWWGQGQVKEFYEKALA
ncbi:MAG: ribonuclease H-like domain-containing protein [Acetobacteraceae bacterium]|nr:ribonuclease H-like domain-containing protein [Acetobacteraceae bacterium]